MVAKISLEDLVRDGHYLKLHTLQPDNPVILWLAENGYIEDGEPIINAEDAVENYIVSILGHNPGWSLSRDEANGFTHQYPELPGLFFPEPEN